jgi:hypothetical protein
MSGIFIYATFRKLDLLPSSGDLVVIILIYFICFYVSGRSPDRTLVLSNSRPLCRLDGTVINILVGPSEFPGSIQTVDTNFKINIK